jgi:uncharacterized membrane protein YuzA (DUF378 family)
MANSMESGRATATLVKTAMVIAIVGAINWGLVGFFNWNLVDAILGGGSTEMTSAASRVVYAIVGLAGLAAIPLLRSQMTHHEHSAGVHSRPRPQT